VLLLFFFVPEQPDFPPQPLVLLADLALLVFALLALVLLDLTLVDFVLLDFVLELFFVEFIIYTSYN